jgi:signal transduction histidine kinase
MVTRTRLAGAVVAITVAVAVLVHAITDNEAVASFCYLGVLVGASVGAWIGSARAPQGQRLVPRLIATGLSLTALGDALWTLLDMLGANTDVSIADPPWFAAYIFLCAALWRVLVAGRDASGARDGVDFLIDAGTIIVVSLLAMWSISVGSILADDSVGPLVRAVWAAYPIADAVLLALVVRILMSRGARLATGTSFAAGTCLWLAADIAYMLAPSSSFEKMLLDPAWMVAPVLMARAAWRSGLVTKEVADSSTSGGVAQLMLAVCPLLVPPTLELVGDLRGAPDNPLLLAIGTVVVVALAFVRTARLLRSEEHAQRQLERARDAALEASRAKSMFLANMSHEIRTPLTTVLAAAEILEDTPLNGLQLKLLGKMHRSGELLKTLVEGILDFSRIEAGQLTLAPRTFDLHAMIGDAADVYGPRASQAGLGFECHLDPRLAQMVVGDPARVFQVLTNLLDNAMKFTRQGKVTLAVRPETSDYQGVGVSRVVRFAVEDSGIGIQAQDQASIFASFNQVDGSTTRKYGGIGLGLAICKELTELMGGTITVQSEYGTGSTFVIHVPLPPATGDQLAPQAERAFNSAEARILEMRAKHRNAHSPVM